MIPIQRFRSLRNILLTLLIALAAHNNVQAQIYPVQVTPQLIAPYTASIPDYYSGSSEKFAVLLINTDLTKPTLQVKLKLNIKSSGVNLVSRDDAYYPPIALDAGVAQRISLGDLAPYFDANNLIFSGMTRAQYEQTRKIPEGFYQVCVEAYEYNTNRLVGHSNCAMAWISLLDPPFLNLPRTSESIAYKDPSNIIFQWTPRSMTNPTSAFNTEYEFTLVELWDNGVAPEAAFSSSQPLYRTTTQATTLLYGPAEPLLIPGKRYGWRVRAQASDGSQNSEAYRNNGYSEIYWFTYQKDCPTPFNVQCDVSGGRATITWNASAQQSRYSVDYREKNQSGSAWYTVNSSTNRVMLYDLTKGKQYEYRVGGYCDLANGSFPADGAVYTDIKTFALDGSGKDDGQACGILQPELKIANRTPIQNLLSGEIITAGDFPVKLINVQGNSNFTGNGYITIPFLGKAAVKVKFSNITVNTDKQLIGGLIETTYDASETQIVGVDTLINDVKGTVVAGVGVGRVKTGEDSVNYTVNFDIPQDCSSCTFTPNNGNEIAATGTNPRTSGGSIDFGGGNTLKTDTMPVTVKDKSGDIYKVEKGADGKVVTTKIGNTGGTDLIAKADKNKLDTDKGTVVFGANAKQQFAFDSYIDAYSNNTNWNKSFEKIGTYRVAAKAIAPGASDVVTATIKLIDGLQTSKVQFVTGKGTIYSAKAVDSTNGIYELTIVGGPANDAQEVYALYPKEGGKPLNLGKLLVASYAQTQLNVKLVPLNGATGFNSQRISDSLNAIYNPVNVKVVVSVAANFDTDVFDKSKGLTISGKNFFNVYSDDMKALNSAYVSSVGVDKNTAYLFVLDRAADGTVLGDMPRSKQFGYIFLQNNNDVEHTVAHEIGHGVFDLQHVFEYSGITQGLLPDNVMDYPAGRNLTKYQWDCLHAPALLAGVFDGNDAGKLANDNTYISIDYCNFKDKILANAQNGKLNFVAPNGKIVSLPTINVAVNFIGNTIDRSTVTAQGGTYVKVYDEEADDSVWVYQLPDVYIMPYYGNGALQGFITNGKKYEAVYTKEGAGIAFSGYFEVDTNNPYSGTLATCNPNTTVICGISDNPCDVQVVVGKMDCGDGWNRMLTSGKKVVSLVNQENLGKLVREGQCDLESIYYLNAFNKDCKSVSEDELNNLSNQIIGLEDINFKAITSSAKVNLVKILLCKDDLTDDNLNAVTKILSTSQNAEQTDLVKLFSDNKYERLYKIYNSYQQYFSGVHFACYGNFVGMLSTLVEKNFSSLNIPITTETETSFSTITGISSVQVPVGEKYLYYLGLDNDETYRSSKVEISVGPYAPTGSVDLTGDRKISLKEIYWAKPIREYITCEGCPLPDDKYMVEVNHSVDPFEPIQVSFVKNYQEEGFNSFETYTMPSIWVLWAQKAVNKAEFHQTLRSAGNAIQIGAAVLTAGESMTATVFISRLAGTAASLDEVVQAERKTLPPQDYNQVKDYYDAWDKVYIATTVADGLVGLYQIGKNWEVFYNLAKRGGSSLKGSLKTAFTTLGDVAKWKSTTEAVAGVENGLAKYPNIRSFLGDGRVNAYLNATEMNTFTDVLRAANEDVLKEMEAFNDGAYFAEMVRGYKLNPNAFKVAIASKNNFVGQLGWLSYWNTAPEMKTALKTIEDLRAGNKLVLSTGNASDLQLAAIHSFTVDGGFLNSPMRYENAAAWATQYREKLLNFVNEGLDELRKGGGRKVVNEVYSGRAYSLTEFNKTFVDGIGKEVAFKGFVSASKKQSVAEGFVELSKQWVLENEKIAVVRRIYSKEGVYIDDISDWGTNFGKLHHADASTSVQIQEEVLMKEGYFKQTSEPILFKEVNGIKYYYVDFEELVKPLIK